MFTGGEANNASERVRRVLDGMKPGGDTQATIALWKFGTLHVPGGAEGFNQAMDEFDRWTAQRGIKVITSYEITSAVVESETDKLGEAAVLVSGEIDKGLFRMRVRQGVPIAWVP